MNTHPGNGRQADGEKLRLALEELEEEVGSQPEPLKNEPLKSSYEAAIVRIGEKGWGPKHEEVPTEQTKTPIETPVVETSSLETLVDSTPSKEDDHVIEWESPIKATPANTETPLAEVLSESAPAVAVEEADRPQTPDEKPVQEHIEATEQRLATENQSQEESWSKFEAIKKRLELMGAETQERAKKGGEYTLKKYREAGEFYKKQPLRNKIFISAGLLGLGFGAATLGGVVGSGVGTAALIGATTQRLFGSAATFVTVEGILKAAEESKTGGKERSEAVKIMHTAEAAILAALVGGGAGGYIMHHWNEWSLRGIGEGFKSSDAAAIEKASANTSPSETPKAGTKLELGVLATSASATEYVVPKGGSVWAGLSEKLGHQPGFEKLSEGQKSYVIDTLKNKLSVMSDADLKTMGISSGNIDKVGVGDKINFDKILNNTKLIEVATDHAKNLSPEQIHNIETSHAVSTGGEADPTPARIIPEGSIEAIPTPAEVIPEGDVSTPAQIIPDTTIPQNFTPASPEDLAEASKTVRVDLDRIIGKSGGFLGFGGTHGIDTPHWKDPRLGFANKTMDEVMNATGRPNGLLPGGEKIGVENYQKVVDMQKYLTGVKTYSTLTPMSGEKVADYIKRAAIALLQQQKS